MKIFLDDVREAPNASWLRFITAECLIEFLTVNPQLVIEVLSLDHDLGDGVMSGHDFISWYEEKIYQRELQRPTDGIFVHRWGNCRICI